MKANNPNFSYSLIKKPIRCIFILSKSTVIGSTNCQLTVNTNIIHLEHNMATETECTHLFKVSLIIFIFNFMLFLTISDPSFYLFQHDVLCIVGKCRSYRRFWATTTEIILSASSYSFEFDPKTKGYVQMLLINNIDIVKDVRHLIDYIPFSSNASSLKTMFKVSVISLIDVYLNLSQ